MSRGRRDYRMWKTLEYTVSDDLKERPMKLVREDWGIEESTWFLGEYIKCDGNDLSSKKTLTMNKKYYLFLVME